MARRSVLALAVALVLAACGGPGPTGQAQSATPTAAPSGAPSALPTASPSPTAGRTPGPSDAATLTALYRQIEDQVIALRGLPLKQRLDPTILSEAELRAKFTAQFAQENTPDQVATSELQLKALGLLPQDASLETLYLDLMGAQVAGFYDPAAKQIYVVARTGTVGPTEKATFAHEFDHALQDQSFDLEKILDAPVGRGDLMLARRAFVEGDATFVLGQWMVGYLSPAELGQILAGDPAAQAALDKVPAILRESLTFPYTAGFAFVNGLHSSGGWPAVDAAFGRLPDSTEQVLHPQKWTAGEEPVAVPLEGAALAARLGAGWKATPEDTLGEFQIRAWLQARGADGVGGHPDGSAAAAGWGGDRIVLLRGPNGAYALAIVTAWDTQKDADEFAAAAGFAVQGLPGAARVVSPATVSGHAGVTVLVVSNASLLDALQAALRG